MVHGRFWRNTANPDTVRIAPGGRDRRAVDLQTNNGAEHVVSATVSRTARRILSSDVIREPDRVTDSLTSSVGRPWRVRTPLAVGTVIARCRCRRVFGQRGAISYSAR
jgi:hypothetical protein